MGANTLENRLYVDGAGKKPCEFPKVLACLDVSKFVGENAAVPYSFFVFVCHMPHIFFAFVHRMLLYYYVAT